MNSYVASVEWVVISKRNWFGCTSNTSNTRTNM